MPNTILDIAYVQAELETNLGNSGVEVELIAADYLKALTQAVRFLNRNKPQRMKTSIAVTAAQKKYLITHAQLQGIVGVEFIDPLRVQSSDIDPFDPLAVLGHGASGLTMEGDMVGQLNQRLIYLEDARRVFSGEPEWFAQWEGNEYYLYVGIVREYLCSYTYTWHVTPDDDANTGLKHINDGDVDWICDYATARVKQTLSRIRGKFGGTGTPTGGEGIVDFAELMSEGREDQLRLEEEMEKRRRPMAPVLG